MIAKTHSSLAALAMLGAVGNAAAIPAADPVGDFLTSHVDSGRPLGGEAPLYVWGIDRGQGAERFLAGSPSIGGGAFDSVLILRSDGGGNVNLFGLGALALVARRKRNG